MMQRRLVLGAGLAGAAVLAGCAGPQVTDYASETPLLDLRQYFNGTLDAYGVFLDRSGHVVRRFTVVMNCSWNGADGVLDEDFIYSDGEKQKRVWRMKYLGEGRYSGTAGDVIGTALGQTSGNAFRWGYTLLLPVGGKPSDAGPPPGASAPSGGSAERAASSVGARIIEVQFDDWMYQMDHRVMLNKAVMSKFGIYLGEVQLTFVKRGA